MVLIRPAELADVPAIVEIHNAVMDTTYEWTEVPHTRQEWADRLVEKGQRTEPVLVLDDSGVLAGLDQLRRLP